MGVEWEDSKSELTDEARHEMKELALDRIAGTDVMFLITEKVEDEKKRLECLWMAPRTKQEVAVLISDIAAILDAIAMKLLPEEMEELERISEGRGYTSNKLCDCAVCQASRVYNEGFKPRKWWQIWRRGK